MRTSGSVSERQETPLSGHGDPIVGTAASDVRDAAAALLRDIAAGVPVEVARVRALAREVLAADLVVSARRVLEAEQAFVLRRGIELAAVLLTPALAPGAGEDGSEGTG